MSHIALERKKAFLSNQTLSRNELKEMAEPYLTKLFQIAQTSQNSDDFRGTSLEQIESMLESMFGMKILHLESCFAPEWMKNSALLLRQY